MNKNDYSSSVLQYIPFFYVIWSDDLVTTSELNVIQKAIDDDASLSKEEKKRLRSWLNPKHPPANEELKRWNHIVSTSGVKLVESETYPLATFSQKVVCEYYEVCPFNESLKHIEINLGIQPNHYNHLFDVEVVHEITSDLYQAASIDALLKGKQAKVVDEFRNILKDDIFKWDIHRTKEEFREIVLNQTKFLAERGYGALAYPKMYGGADDMEGYAHMFENMMFVDGSLTIKFGVQVGLFGGSIQKLGTKKHHDQYLADAGAAKLLGCFAMTETGHGSNVRGIKTTATYDKQSDSIVIQESLWRTMVTNSD